MPGAGGGSGGGGAGTVTVAVAVLPETVASIIADPAATAATRPLELTVAIAVESERHETDCPVIVLPAASLATAVAWVELPIANVGDAMLTETVVTTGAGGDRTVIEAVPAFSPTLPSIEAAPGATAVTSPLVDTAAMAGDSDFHVTV